MEIIVICLIIAVLCFVLFGVVSNFEKNKNEAFEKVLTESGFIISQRLNYSGLISEVFYVDAENQLWAVSKEKKAFRFQDIVKVDIIQDEKTISSGGLGRALGFGLLTGGVGAIVGATTGKKTAETKLTDCRVKITIDDFHNPVIYINCLTGDKKTSVETAQKFLSVLDLILVKGKAKPTKKQDEIIAKFSQRIAK